MKILVLGGTGAMGNALVTFLIRTKNEIYVTSRKTKISNDPNLKYIRGNAQEYDFINELLIDNHYDAIVDFMNYSTNTFSERAETLLNATDQYIFLSSSRVYAGTDDAITEDSNLLIDVCEDKKYVQSDEYAIAKVRQERLLVRSGRSNWTIVRPYITYGDERLQLGFMEKELWLYRILRGRSLVIGRDICEHETTLTSGKLVAYALTKMIGNRSCLGQTYNITQPNSVKWREVLDEYIHTIEKVLERRPNIIQIDSSNTIGKVCGRLEQIKYDRLYDRKFDPTKVLTICPELNYASNTIEELKILLEEFLKSGRHFRDIDWRAEGYMDKIAHELTPLSEISGARNKLKYIVARFTPYYELR